MIDCVVHVRPFRVNVKECQYYYIYPSNIRHYQIHAVSYCNYCLNVKAILKVTDLNGECSYYNVQHIYNR